MERIINRLLVVAAFFTLISCDEGGVLKSNTPGDVVKDMVESIVDEDFGAFMALNINEKGKAPSAKELEQTKAIMVFLKEDIDEKGGLREVLIHEEKISEDGLTAVVKVQLVYNDGKKAPEGNTELIKVDGVWKIKNL